MSLCVVSDVVLYTSHCRAADKLNTKHLLELKSCD